MPRQNYLDVHLAGTLHHCFEIVHLEPQQYPVSVWLVFPIAYPPVMVLYFEVVQLKHQLAVPNQLLIRGAPMIAPQAQQPLIPPAARFHIRNGDQRLRTHLISLSGTRPQVAALVAPIN